MIGMSICNIDRKLRLFGQGYIEELLNDFMLFQKKRHWRKGVKDGAFKPILFNTEMVRRF